MRTYRSTSGPFCERPHYEVQEIERICLDSLDQVGCLPKAPQSIRIDRFIEKRFGLVPTYDELGDSLLGFTRFGANGATQIVLSRHLDEEGTVTSNRRIRATLAHEAGHILLQGHLFGLETLPSLFERDKDVTNTTILCRDGAGYDGRWWEYQANRAIGELLLPRQLVWAAVENLLVEDGTLGIRTLPADAHPAAEAHVATIFDVNGVVARRRLTELWPEASAGQMSL